MTPGAIIALDDRDAHLGTIPPGLLTALTTIESRIIIGSENTLGS